ncbi:MAG: outer membrane protein assembly factor BamC [Gammaproteobacteria bacterium]|nr:outer membrane protein assembly factor BamC [Gammaproteobacteria bacterium]
MLNKLYFVVFATALMIGGCSSDGNERRQEYLDADYYTRLELPPDLTSSIEKDQLSIPRPSDEATTRFKQDTANLGSAETQNTVAMAIKVKGARMQAGDGVFWLEIDENADKLWPQLSAFWSHEGIKITRNEPMLGMVETDWVSKMQIDDDAGFIARLFSSASPDKLDKFRMRVEPEQSNDKTKIFMSHSGMEKLVEGDDVNWRSRCTEEELEREMLNRLALFVGLDKAQSQKAFENYRPFASRVEVPKDKVNALYIVGDMDFVWKRSLRALDRMGMDVLEKDSSTHQIKVAIERLSKEDLGQERDEIAESSWLMKWLSGSGEDYAEDESRQFTIRLDNADGVIHLGILRPDGEPADSVLAEQLRKSLAIEFQ